MGNELQTLYTRTSLTDFHSLFYHCEICDEISFLCDDSPQGAPGPRRGLLKQALGTDLLQIMSVFIAYHLFVLE